MEGSLFIGDVHKSPLERTIHRAARTIVVLPAFFVFPITGTTALAAAQVTDGDDEHGKDNEQYYDGGQIHAMTALAMR